MPRANDLAALLLLAIWRAWCHVTGVPRNALSAYDYVNQHPQHG